MDQCYFVLPITEEGTLNSVDVFLENEGLDGCVFTSANEAEKTLLEMYAQYEGCRYFDKFGLFTCIAHAEKTELGHKVIPTV